MAGIRTGRKNFEVKCFVSEQEGTEEFEIEADSCVIEEFRGAYVKEPEKTVPMWALVFRIGGFMVGMVPLTRVVAMKFEDVDE